MSSLTHAHTMSFYLWNHANRHQIWSKKCITNKTRPRLRMRMCVCVWERERERERDAYHCCVNWPTELSQPKTHVCINQPFTHTKCGLHEFLSHTVMCKRAFQQSFPKLNPLCKQVKGLLHPKSKILSSITQPHGVPNPYDCNSSFGRMKIDISDLQMNHSFESVCC